MHGIVDRVLWDRLCTHCFIYTHKHTCTSLCAVCMHGACRHINIVSNTDPCELSPERFCGEA